MSAIKDRERAVLIDLTRTAGSADAVRQLEAALEETKALLAPDSLVDISTGDLLLTPGVLAKMKSVIHRFGADVDTLYSNVPQTQQSALDEGFFVRSKPPAPKRFNPNNFVAEAYKDLDLPFESSSAPAILSPIAQPEPLGKLSVTLEDGTREEVTHSIVRTPVETVYYKQTLRSGQLLEAAGNVVIIGDSHSGSEIMADGDITVWGFLGGIAHAGRNGNTNSEIRAMRIEAVQLRIGHHIARRPDRLFKQQQKHRGPEVAKVRDGEIQIYEEFIER